MNLNQVLNDLNKRITIAEHEEKKCKEANEKVAELTQTCNDLATEIQALETTYKTLLDYKVKQKDFNSQKITDAITTVVGIVFPEKNYQYKFKSKTSRGHTYTDLVFEINGQTLIPKLSNGNGVQQCASNSTVTTMLALGHHAPVEIADEPFTGLSPDKSPIMGKIIEYFANQGLQYIIIDHDAKIFDEISYYEYTFKNRNHTTELEGVLHIDRTEVQKEEQ